MSELTKSALLLQPLDHLDYPDLAIASFPSLSVYLKLVQERIPYPKSRFNARMKVCPLSNPYAFISVPSLNLTRTSSLL